MRGTFYEHSCHLVLGCPLHSLGAPWRAFTAVGVDSILFYTNGAPNNFKARTGPQQAEKGPLLLLSPSVERSRGARDSEKAT